MLSLQFCLCYLFSQVKYYYARRITWFCDNSRLFMNTCSANLHKWSCNNFSLKALKRWAFKQLLIKYANGAIVLCCLSQKQPVSPEACYKNLILDPDTWHNVLLLNNASKIRKLEKSEHWEQNRSIYCSHNNGGGLSVNTLTSCTSLYIL